MLKAAGKGAIEGALAEGQVITGPEAQKIREWLKQMREKKNA